MPHRAAAPSLTRRGRAHRNGGDAGGVLGPGWFAPLLRAGDLDFLVLHHLAEHHSSEQRRRQLTELHRLPSMQ
jgi:hypothetical protein